MKYYRKEKEKMKPSSSPAGVLLYRIHRCCKCEQLHSTCAPVSKVKDNGSLCGLFFTLFFVHFVSTHLRYLTKSVTFRLNC